MELFQIICKISPYNLVKMNSLRESHLLYIQSKGNEVVYGGLLLNDDQSISGIVYYVLSSSLKSASHFTENDPYFAIYSEIVVQKFIQKKP